MSGTMRSLTVVVCAALLAATAQAQMSGKYTIDPSGTGSRNFKDFANASYQLFVQGVSGPVTIEAVSGTYNKKWSVGPYKGASATNTITFTSKTPLGAKVGAGTGELETVTIPDYTENFPVQWIVFDGLEFINTRGRNSNGFYTQRAIGAQGSAKNIEIRNCKFQATIVRVLGNDRAADWRIHHNSFEADYAFRAIELNGVGTCDIYNNIISLRESDYAILRTSTYKGTARLSRIYNNVISGTVRAFSSAIQVDLGADIDHNTVVLDGNGLNYCLQVAGMFGRPVEIRNNILINLGKGPALRIFSLKGFKWLADGNIYQANNSTRGVIYHDVSNPTSFTTLSSWQQASGQDQNSMFTDPKLEGGAGLPDRFKLKDGSPAAGAAKNTRSWITVDFAGTKRPTPASIGAYEGVPAASFVTFGQGCAGTFNNVPKMGYTGDLKFGSTNFTVTLSNALGGAKTIFAIGVSRTKIGGTNLPLPFGGGCSLLTSSDLMFQLTTSGSGPGNGTAAVKFTIPNNLALKGTQLHLQWGVVDSAAGGIGVAFSDAATVTL